MTRYTRQDVLRLLHLRTGQHSAWKRAGLIASFPHDVSEDSFAHLAAARRLPEMRTAAGRRRVTQRVSARRMRVDLRSLESWKSMEKVEGMMDTGNDIATAHPAEKAESASRGGRLLRSPAQQSTQQLRLNFETFGGELKVVNAAPLRVVGGRPFALPSPSTSQTSQISQDKSDAAQVQEIFLRAVRLEENPATVAEAAALYRQILCRKPDHAPAAINLGTIFYNRRAFAEAEGMYRRATETDPGYALAFFDLGNVLDEMQRLDEAIAAYTEAITLLPAYADAHYNLALAFERQGERRRALRHWTAYVRLDPVGPWAQHARSQARTILSLERLSIVSRSGRKAAIAG